MQSSISSASGSSARPRLLAGLLAGLLCALPAAAADGQRPDPVLRELLRQAMNEPHGFEDRFDAQVWLTDMAQRLGDQVADPQERIEILKTVHREAKRADLAPELVLAVIDVESAFDPYAVSDAGAQGLMQVMPFWLNEIGRPDDRLVDIQTNLRMGCTILRHYLDMENGDLRRALARYHGSVGSGWYPERVLSRLSSRWFQL
ncbi:MAG: lytic transglycosylase domain-containing protein [Gammaproteobacteria bacterium]|nr:MAG: lytic transglycosylase domain-containing protein [Gammaproteobacteria bacterium]